MIPQLVQIEDYLGQEHEIQPLYVAHLSTCLTSLAPGTTIIKLSTGEEILTCLTKEEVKEKLGLN